MHQMTAADREAIEREHDAEITDAMEALGMGLSSANANLAHTNQVLTRLRGNELYEVNYAESHVGADIAHHLQDAMRSLRAAHALHQSIAR
jgi:hypothetical protein